MKLKKIRGSKSLYTNGKIAWGDMCRVYFNRTGTESIRVFINKRDLLGNKHGIVDYRRGDLQKVFKILVEQEDKLVKISQRNPCCNITLRGRHSTKAIYA